MGVNRVGALHESGGRSCFFWNKFGRGGEIRLMQRYGTADLAIALRSSGSPQPEREDTAESMGKHALGCLCLGAVVVVVVVVVVVAAAAEGSRPPPTSIPSKRASSCIVQRSVCWKDR